MYAVFAACSLLFLSASFSQEFTLHSDPPMVKLLLGTTTEESDTDASGNFVLALGAESWRCCRYTATCGISLSPSNNPPFFFPVALFFMEAGFGHGGGTSSSSCWGKNGAWSKLRDEPYLARKDKGIMLVANVTATPSICTSTVR